MRSGQRPTTSPVPAGSGSTRALRPPRAAARRPAQRVLLLLLMGFAGCGDGDGGPATLATRAALNLPPAHRWIGIDVAIPCAPGGPQLQCAQPQCAPPQSPDANPCPTAPGWNASRLFRFTAPGHPGPIPLPNYLLRYCLYVWAMPGPPDVNLLNAHTAGHIVNLSEDRALVAPQGVSDVVRPYQRSQLRDAARGFGPLPPNPVVQVEMALLDSSPDAVTGAIPLGFMAHGHVMGWTASDLTFDAPNGPRLASIRSRLTLPFRDDLNADSVNGGTVGVRGDLALSLFAAVEAWRWDVAMRPRLAIPLAVGWSAAEGPEQEASSQAVHDALLHAGCYGAFVAAAAGNDTGGPAPQGGPLLPAAWESEPAPTAMACNLLCDNASFPAPFPYPILPAPPGPLLLSVGGLDYADHPIVRTRPGSLSKLAALAFEATGGDPQAPSLPPAHTGTSVAAVVAASAAAAMWAYGPQQTAPALMKKLIDTSQSLPAVGQSQCLGGVCEVRRLSYCDALAAACPGCQLVCNHVPTATSNPSWDQPSLDALVHDFPRKVTPAPPAGANDDAWNKYQSVAVGPWLGPQPQDPGCSICGVSRSASRVDILWNTAYGNTVHDLVLNLSGQTFYLAESVDPGQQISATFDAQDYTEATLSWWIGATLSGTQSISIVD